MDIKLVKKLIDDLKDNLGDALLMSDISSFKVGSSVASHNANPKTAALVNKFSKYLIEMINKAGVGDSCSYYACEVEGGIMMYVLFSGDYCWSIMVDSNQVTNGLMLVGVLPDCMKDLKKAVDTD
jgi:hypothetical protein